MKPAPPVTRQGLIRGGSSNSLYSISSLRSFVLKMDYVFSHIRCRSQWLETYIRLLPAFDKGNRIKAKIPFHCDRVHCESIIQRLAWPKNTDAFIATVSKD